jgi:hypothetical protein
MPLADFLCILVAVDVGVRAAAESTGKTWCRILETHSCLTPTVQHCTGGLDAMLTLNQVKRTRLKSEVNFLLQLNRNLGIDVGYNVGKDRTWAQCFAIQDQ